MRIDTHCHLLAPEYVRAVIRLAEQGDPVARRSGAFRRADDPAITSVDLLLAAMDGSRIDVAVLSMTPPSAFVADQAAALQMARVTNDFYADLARRQPDRFWAVAALPMLHPDEALTELRRAIDDLGLAGIGLGGTVGGYPLDDPRFAPIFAEVDRRRLPVLIHPMRSPADPVFDDFGLNVVLGFVYDTSAGVLRFIMSGARDRYPDFPMVVTHLGGTLPFLQGRLDDQGAWGTYRPPGRVGRDEPTPRRPPSAYLRELYFDTVSHHLPALRCVVDSVGADRLLVGSDYPWVWDAMPRAVEQIEDSGLPEADRAGILGLNAERVFGPKGGHITGLGRR